MKSSFGTARDAQAYFHKWVAACPWLTPEEKARLLAIEFPLPPMHQFAHTATCQVAYAPHKFVGAGTAVGEPPEAFWAKIGRLAYRVLYMEEAKMHTVLEAYVKQSNYANDVSSRVWPPTPPSERPPHLSRCISHCSLHRPRHISVPPPPSLPRLATRAAAEARRMRRAHAHLSRRLFNWLNQLLISVNPTFRKSWRCTLSRCTTPRLSSRASAQQC